MNRRSAREGADPVRSQPSVDGLRFLADVSRQLQLSLDYEATARDLAALFVPTIAEWCAVDLLTDDGSFRRLGTAAVTVARDRVLRMLGLRFPLRQGQGRLRGRVAATGRPIALYDLDDARLARVARDEAHLALLRRLGVRSAIWVPLIARGRTVGVLSFGTGEGGRRLDPNDLALAALVAERAAVSLDNARLYGNLAAREAQLAERDERLTLALRASRTGIWEYDLLDGSLLWSDEILALHGLAPGQAPADLEAYLDLIHPGDREGFQEAVGAAVRERSAFDLEFRLVWPDGSVHWTNGVGRVFTDASGRPVRMIGTGRDVTDRKEAEAERDRLMEAEREATKMRDAFIGVLSHELRTPITTIYAGAKLVSRTSGELAADTRTEVIEDIAEEAERLYRLVEDLLVLTRAERGGLEIGSEPVMLPRVVRRVVDSEASRWPAVSFVLAADPEDGRLPLVAGDETYLEQILRNLLGNAAKYSAAEGEVGIRVEEDEDGVSVRILDRGVGFDRDEAEALFRLFYRSAVVASSVKGAGIGLWVCRRLVEAMGGRIWATPRDDGGAEFGFWLAAYREDPRIGA